MRYHLRSLKGRLIALLAGILMPMQVGWALPPLTAASAGAELAGFIAQAGLPDAQWSPVEIMQVQGVPFYFSRVTMGNDLAAVLEALTQNDSPLEQILFASNQVLLSGWRHERHWLLHLSAVGEKIEGTLSILPFRQEAQDKSPVLRQESILSDWSQAYSRLRQASLQEQP